MAEEKEFLTLGFLVPLTVIILFFSILIRAGYLHDDIFYAVRGFLYQDSINSAYKVVLHNEGSPIEQIVSDITVSAAEPEDTVVSVGEYTYVKIIDSCEYDYSDGCVRARSGPGTEYGVLNTLRNDIILKVDEKITNEAGESSYKIDFDEWLRYPERLGGDWYVSAEFVEVFKNDGEILLTADSRATDKEIIVDRSDQKLYAFDGEVLYAEMDVSTGHDFTPTPRGEFTVFKKTPSRYMQGPLPYLPVQDVYDLPGVPWNLYFTEQGAVIHGAYWHDSFGSTYSHGCVNLEPEDAEEIYKWADIGTKVIVRD